MGLPFFVLVLFGGYPWIFLGFKEIRESLF